MFPYQKEKESTRLLREAFEERMRIEHPFTAKQLKQFDDLKALLARIPKLSIADKLQAEEAAKQETCTAQLDKQKEQSEERRLRSLQRRRRKAQKGVPDSDASVETAPTSPPPLWPRPDLQDPVSSSTFKVSSTPLPRHVWLITQTTFASDSALKFLCLCTTLPDANTVMTHLADEFALRTIFYLPQGAKRALKSNFIVQKYARKDNIEFGFDACVEGKMAVDVKASWEEGAVWQGKISDEKVLGEGFEEVTVESVRGIMKQG